MESGLEAAGGLVTATAAAQALDPDEPRAEVHGERCPNCSATITGAYCGACGQKAHLHRSVLHAAEEFLHGITHFDSKLWNTLPLLFFRPGKLTREYVHGRRARYVAPVALFLLTVFSMFFIFGFLGGGPSPGVLLADPAQRAEAVAVANKGIAAIEADLKAAEADPGRKNDVVALKLARQAAILQRDRLLAEQNGAPIAQGNSISDIIRKAEEAGEINVELGDEEINIKAREALRNPEFVFYKMKQKGYKLSFLLVPLSLPWMIILFAWKRGIHVYDHVVFLLYSISFMSMLAIVATLLVTYTSAPAGVYTVLLLFLPLLHMFLQLKESYALGWASAAWRTVALASLATVTLLIYFVIILLLGLLD